MISPTDKHISKSMKYSKYLKDLNEAREAKTNIFILEGTC